MLWKFPLRARRLVLLFFSLRADIPGDAYAVVSSHAQAATGGGLDKSRDVAFVYLGSWTAAAIERGSDGGERFQLSRRFDKAAPLLAVQCIRIRIEANPQLATTIVKQIDFDALYSLLVR
jgi:hypothetical protein